jgi:hypothetical protein
MTALRRRRREAPQFEAAEHIDGRLIVQTDRWTWFAPAATTPSGQ